MLASEAMERASAMRKALQGDALPTTPRRRNSSRSATEPRSELLREMLRQRKEQGNVGSPRSLSAGRKVPSIEGLRLVTKDLNEDRHAEEVVEELAIAEPADIPLPTPTPPPSTTSSGYRKVTPGTTPRQNSGVSRAMVTKEYEAALDRIKNENFDLKLRICLQEERAKKLQTQLEEALEQLEEMRKENDGLKEENDELKNHNAVLTDQVEGLDEDMVIQRDNNAELLTINEELCSELERRDTALHEAAGMIFELDEKVKGLEVTVGDCKEASTAAAAAAVAAAAASAAISPPSNPPDSDYYSTTEAESESPRKVSGSTQYSVRSPKSTAGHSDYYSNASSPRLAPPITLDGESYAQRAATLVNTVSISGNNLKDLRQRVSIASLASEVVVQKQSPPQQRRRYGYSNEPFGPCLDTHLTKINAEIIPRDRQPTPVPKTVRNSPTTAYRQSRLRPPQQVPRGLRNRYYQFQTPPPAQKPLPLQISSPPANPAAAALSALAAGALEVDRLKPSSSCSSTRTVVNDQDVDANRLRSLSISTDTTDDDAASEVPSMVQAPPPRYVPWMKPTNTTPKTPLDSYNFLFNGFEADEYFGMSTSLPQSYPKSLRTKKLPSSLKRKM